MMTIHARRLTGRGHSTGDQSGASIHAVEDSAYPSFAKALCGVEPKETSAGWSEQEFDIVTCPMCEREMEEKMAAKKTPMKKKSDNRDFYAGIITALAILTLHDQQTIWQEVVDTCDKEVLLRHARKEGELEFAGFCKYRQCGHRKCMKEDER